MEGGELTGVKKREREPTSTAGSRKVAQVQLVVKSIFADIDNSTNPTTDAGM